MMIYQIFKNVDYQSMMASDQATDVAIIKFVPPIFYWTRRITLSIFIYLYSSSCAAFRIIASGGRLNHSRYDVELLYIFLSQLKSYMMIYILQNDYLSISMMDHIQAQQSEVAINRTLNLSFPWMAPFNFFFRPLFAGVHVCKVPSYAPAKFPVSEITCDLLEFFLPPWRKAISGRHYPSPPS